MTAFTYKCFVMFRHHCCLSWTDFRSPRDAVRESKKLP